LGDTGSGKAQISTGSSASVGGSGTGVIPQQAQQIPQCRDIKGEYSRIHIMRLVRILTDKPMKYQQVKY
jgi:hypothetical protein